MQVRPDQTQASEPESHRNQVAGSTGQTGHPQHRSNREPRRKHREADEQPGRPAPLHQNGP
jgi:hypothetical protein